MRRKLLVIDDEAVIREVLVDHLDRHGYDAEAVASVREGVSRAREQAFDAVLLDLALAETKGLASLDEFRAAVPAVPVLILTGLPVSEQLERAVIERGALELLSKMKPFENVTMRLARMFRQE
ncbi:MAG: response regulator [Verrucomicrobia bacterium]|nr:response regulator [Verrucomicrobiota bacterium]